MWQRWSRFTWHELPAFVTYRPGFLFNGCLYLRLFLDFLTHLGLFKADAEVKLTSIGMWNTHFHWELTPTFVFQSHWEGLQWGLRQQRRKLSAAVPLSSFLRASLSASFPLPPHSALLSLYRGVPYGLLLLSGENSRGSASEVVPSGSLRGPWEPSLAPAKEESLKAGIYSPGQCENLLSHSCTNLELEGNRGICHLGTLGLSLGPRMANVLTQFHPVWWVFIGHQSCALQKLNIWLESKAYICDAIWG